MVFREKALLHLYRNVNIAMEEVANEKLHNSVRSKWAYCLAQTVATPKKYKSPSSESGNDEKDDAKAKTISLRLYKYVAINDS